MKDLKTRKIVTAALFAALTFCATFLIKIHTPTNGYVNLGDSFVLTSGWLLGPVYGTLAAATGSMLSDLAAGYAVYLLPTFLIKGLMAFAAWGIYRLMGEKTGIFGRIITAVICEIIMVSGYYLVEATFLSYGFLGAAAGIPANLVQGLFGVITSVLITELLTKNKYIKKWL